MQSQIILLQSNPYQLIVRLHQADRVARHFIGACIWLTAIILLAILWFSWRAIESGQWGRQQWEYFHAELNYRKPIALLMPAVEPDKANDTLALQAALALHADKLLDIQSRRHQRILAIAPRTDLGNWYLSRKGQELISKAAIKKAYDLAVAPLREAAA